MSNSLSKSRFVSGTQCEKKLFFDVYRKDLKPAVAPTQQALFDMGHALGRLAQEVFPNGLDASEGMNGKWSIAIDRTRQWIEKGEPTIYEAAFSIPGGFAALDILHHTQSERWAIEVKSSGGVKEYHITDASFQYYVMKKAGFPPDKVFLMHVNSDYIKQGPLSPSELFHLEDITDQVLANQPAVALKHTELLNMLNRGEEPQKQIGPHCNDPFDCDYKSHCWAGLPAKNVFDLYSARGKDWELYKKGIHALTDIPDNYELNHRQRLQVRGIKLGESHIDLDNIKEFLVGIQGPLYFFDFETINPVIPVLNATSPFEQTPFQYSLHETDIDGQLVAHKEFLADPASFTNPSATDPRRSLIEQLKKDIGPNGSIIAYNAAFEIGVLKRLAIAFPEHESFLESIIDRFVDLLIPFRKAWYYLPAMGGSASIKDVLPAIAPEFSYKDLPINNGGQASETFLLMINDGVKEDHAKIRTDMLAYCERDSLGMVIIYRHLRELS
ncbi:MAG: DUF2779 domain-containing protein [Bacteroidota bacterium]